MCGLLFERLDDITNPDCCVVSQQDVDMVFVRFHRNDLISVSFTDVKQFLLQIIGNVPHQNSLSVLCDEYKMYLQTVFPPVVFVIAIRHIVPPFDIH